MDPLTQLSLRQALIDNYNNYAEGLDTKNWPMVLACFSDQVFLDYGDVGEVNVSAQAAADWIAHLQSVINGFDLTHHAITNHRLTVDDGRVNCRAYMVADHVIFPDPAIAEVGPEDRCTVVGEYSNDYEQQADGRWTICYSRLSVKWSSGNTEVFVTAATRVAAAS